MKNHNTPVIVGVGQFTQRKSATTILDPMGLMVKTSEMAIRDCGNPKIKDVVDGVYVVNIQTLSYEDAPDMFSRAIGITPVDKYYSGIGGNTPQKLVNRAAAAIAAGKNKAIMITGGEAMYSLRRSMMDRVALDWSIPQHSKYDNAADKNGFSEIEADYGLELPTTMYPFFETALRGASGRGIGAHRRYMGDICEYLSKVASQNPYGWNQTAISAAELILPIQDNRYITYPYTKRMVANLFVDQSASLIMTSVAVAEDLGINPALWVYPMGGMDLNDIWYVTRRPRIHQAPALGIAAKTAMDQAGVVLEDIGFFDFYSCFPCAVEMARQAVGLSPDDPRDLSVTGGLSYFGGPMNNYSLHSVCSTVDKIRKEPSLTAMVTSVGWYMTKHAVVIYGKQPGRISWEEEKDGSLQKTVDEKSLPDPVKKAEGRMTVEAYIVIHDRDDRPERGVVMGRLSDGQRAIADIWKEASFLETCEEKELVGKTGTVAYDNQLGRNLILFDHL